MIALAACITDHWHAVERDLLAIGKRADDILTPNLTLCELISVVLAAPPGTAIHHFDPARWSKTDELIANMTEQQAGLVSLNGRYPRPQVNTAEYRPRSAMDMLAPWDGIVFDAAPVDEFTARLKEKQRKAREQYT
jgi:hypothetical protein